jgi:hypothetical protein
MLGFECVVKGSFEVERGSGSFSVHQPLYDDEVLFRKTA